MDLSMLGALTRPLREIVANKWFNRIAVPVVIGFAIVFPLFFVGASPFINNTVQALVYVVMALGLNVVVGFAGLLDLGYVAFYAMGSYAIGWFGSEFLYPVNHQKGVHFLVSRLPGSLPGVHINFFIVIVIAAALAAAAGAVIGLPTLRLRGDYIAIVTLAFGEIIGNIAANGDQLHFGQYTLTAGRQGITPVDVPNLPGVGDFSPLNNRPWYYVALALVLIVLFCNVRLRDSRLGRAWIALREDEVAAASMGVPIVRTKLLAYATGAAFGGMAGVLLSSYTNTVNADSFNFSFSIFVLAMVILGGLGSIWGVVLGALALSYFNTYGIPDVLGPFLKNFGLDVTQLGFGIFGFVLVLMMVLRPQGLLPERRRKLEMTQGIGADESLVEVNA
ncbi:MAG: branched-chain amino acid ABC transporter permease [Solirubrobacteraceae bacterium]|nr:MAG: branched-chain amino acid ABC transporter permease [Solirubrobacterales bacterium]